MSCTSIQRFNLEVILSKAFTPHIKMVERSQLTDFDTNLKPIVARLVIFDLGPLYQGQTRIIQNLKVLITHL